MSFMQSQTSLLQSPVAKGESRNSNSRKALCMKPIIDRGLHWWLDSRGAIINILPSSFTGPTGLDNLLGSRFWELGSQVPDQARLKASIGEAILAKENTSFFCSMKNLLHGEEVRVLIFVNESAATQVAVSVFTQPLLQGHQQLSSQESKALEILANGCLPQEIADQMSCSRSTVQTYLLRARKKLNIDTFVGLTAYAARIH